MNRKWFFSTCITAAMVFAFDSLQAKVLVMTHSYNRPDFISLQQETLKAFLQDEYEYVVFNDGPTQKLAKQIEETCQGLQIRCIRVPQEIHQQPYLARQPWEDWNSPSIRTANAIQYSFDTLGFEHEGIVTVIDSDMFLIRSFSIEEYMKDWDIAAVAQWRGSMRRINYLWNGLMFFKMGTLPNKSSLNFNCGSIDGNLTDTGGFTYYYLKNNPEVKVSYMVGQLDLTGGDYIVNSYDLEEREYLSAEDLFAIIGSNPHLVEFIKDDPDDVQFFLDCAFLHYRRAGNYHHKPNNYHLEKTELLLEFIEGILQGPKKPHATLGFRERFVADVEDEDSIESPLEVQAEKP
jgi:hypothetical protein